MTANFDFSSCLKSLNTLNFSNRILDLSIKMFNLFENCSILMKSWRSFLHFILRFQSYCQLEIVHTPHLHKCSKTNFFFRYFDSEKNQNALNSEVSIVIFGHSVDEYFKAMNILNFSSKCMIWMVINSLSSTDFSSLPGANLTKEWVEETFYIYIHWNYLHKYIVGIDC